MILLKRNFKLHRNFFYRKILHLTCPYYCRFGEKREESKKERTSEGSDEGRTHARRLCRLDTAIVVSASVNGSPDSFERVGRRFTTIGCSRKDGKSAQGDGGLSIRRWYQHVSIRVGAFLKDADIHNIYCTLKLKCKF